MSELISGKEAICKAIDGEDVLFKCKSQDKWHSFIGETWEVSDLVGDFYEFRLKPRTITIGNIEVPSPFEPNEFEDCYMLSDLYEHGYTKTSWKYSKSVPAWRSEDEIKQVVAALRSVFNVK